MTVNDNAKKAEGLSDFFKNLGKKGLNVTNKMTKKSINEPGQDLEVTANFATAASSRNLKNVISTLPELITSL